MAVESLGLSQVNEASTNDQAISVAPVARMAKCTRLLIARSGVACPYGRPRPIFKETRLRAYRGLSEDIIIFQ